MKKRDIFQITLPLMVIFFFFIWGICQPDQAYSDAERRVLQQKPKLTQESVVSGKFMSQFETYTLDQFPMRNAFRTLKAYVVRDLFGKKEDHGYYMAQGYLSKLEYPMNQSRIENSILMQQKVYDSFLKGTDCHIYQGIIFDKNYYLAPQNGYPVMDYDAYVDMVKKGTQYATFVDLSDCLSLEDFYKTDQHVKQEGLMPMAKKIGDALKVDVTTEYEVKTLEVPFYGAYKDQSALAITPDTITYLTNEELAACKVTSYNTGMPKASQMYDFKKAQEKDPYEMFLSGSDAFLTIENPNASTNRELVLFRDSFGSSLAPLLVHGYAKITLVDLRYIRSEALGQLMEFTNQDVLFLYSTLVY